MTRPANSDTESIELPGQGGLSRRELRKQQMLRDAAAGIIKPQSIFDLEYVPRPRTRGVEPAEVPEVEAPEAEVTEAESVGEESPAPKPAAVSPFIEVPAPKPAVVPSPRATSKTAITPTTPAPSALLFERIPEAVSSSPVTEAKTAAVDSGAQPKPLRRNKFAVIAASAAIFGFVLTLSLPALDPTSDTYTSAANAQELQSGDTAGSQFDIEGFESVDELESAADAAMLRADTYVNDTSSSVQYPFDVGVPLTDGFGPRMFPVSGFHDAQDFAPGYGAPVRSIADGTVIESGPTSDGCGFGLKVKHRIEGHDVESRYCHLAAAPVVGVGEKVRVGQFVALVGATGIAFGPHLHMVIELDGEAVDPMPFFAKYNKSTSGALTKKSAGSTPTPKSTQTAQN